MFPNSSRYHNHPTEPSKPSLPRTLTPTPQQIHTARDRSPLQNNFTMENTSNSPPHVRSRPNLYAAPFIDGNRNVNFQNPSLISNPDLFVSGPRPNIPRNSPYNPYNRSTSQPRLQENSPSPNKSPLPTLNNIPQGLQNFEKMRKNIVICPITHQPLIRQPPPSIFEQIKAEPRPITPKITQIPFQQRSKTPIQNTREEKPFQESHLTTSALSPNTHQNTSPTKNYHYIERPGRQSPETRSPLPEPRKSNNEVKFNLFELQRPTSRNKTPEIRTPSTTSQQSQQIIHSHREHRVKTPAEYNFYPAPPLRNTEYIRTEEDYKTPERRRNPQGYGENLTSRSPVKFETPVKEYDDDYCTNCVNGQLAEDRKRKEGMLKEMDREKERETARKGLNKMRRDEEWEKIKRIERLEEGKVMQRMLEDDYEKKLDARRNKKGGLERTLFDGIFERQEKINQQQKEMMRTGLKNMNEEMQKDNRKKSPKEKYMEFLDHQKAKNFGVDYNNPFLPTAEEVNRFLQQQMNSRLDRQRVEREKDVQLANAVINKAQKEMRTENEMIKKKTYDLREQQRLQLAELQAQKETLRERAKLEKEKEKMKIDEQVMGQRYKQANEEHNKKKKELEDQRQAMDEAARNKCIKTQREKDWEMNIKRHGNDEGMLHGMGHDKQKKYKCCPGCHKQVQAQQITKNAGVMF